MKPKKELYISVRTAPIAGAMGISIGILEVKDNNKEKQCLEETENDNIKTGSNRITSSRDRYKFVRDRKYHNDKEKTIELK